MFWNYLKVAWRNLLRHPLYATINVVGLGIAISFCLLAFLYVRYEWTYDGFHENADRIYRVYAEFEDSPSLSRTPRALAPALTEALPGVRPVRLNSRARRIHYRGESTPASFLSVDPAFLEIFTFPLIKGNPATALDAPDYVVISDAMAEEYFPGEDPIGKTISVQDVKGMIVRGTSGESSRSFGSGEAYSGKGLIRELTVTGVIRAAPRNSSIRFDFLSALEPAAQEWGWGLSVVETFILIPENLTQAEIEDRLASLPIPWSRGRTAGNLKLQPLGDIYFDTGGLGIAHPGNSVYSYVLAGIATLVLVVAVVNYTNLAVGWSFVRGREVGMRKVAGGLRLQLARQFVGESVMLTLVALALGLALAELFMPGFNSLIRGQFAISDVADSTAIVFLLVLALGVGTVAGGYPAFLMSGFLPVETMKGRFGVDRMRTFGRALVVFQLAISTALVICMTIGAVQVYRMKSRPLGFDASHVVVVRLFGTLERPGLVETFEEAIRPYHSVLKTSRTSHGFSNMMRNSTQISWEGTTLEGIERIFCDLRFLDTMDIRLVEGRDFERDSDAETSVMVNESLARKLGSEAPLGETIRIDGRELTVIGVVRDFHFRSLHHAIAPAVMQLQTSSSVWPRWDVRYLLMVRIRPENVSDTLGFLRKKWGEIVPDKQFNYHFLDEDIDRQYREERRWFKIAGYATFIAVLIACLGAFGLTSLTVARRTKEIGIRKVLGAPTSRIVLLLTREYVILVGIATLIASPVTYIAAEDWLQNFAYRVDPGIGTFLLGGLLTLLVVLLAVSLQVTRAARANPVDALRYE